MVKKIISGIKDWYKYEKLTLLVFCIALTMVMFIFLAVGQCTYRCIYRSFTNLRVEQIIPRATEIEKNRKVVVVKSIRNIIVERGVYGVGAGIALPEITCVNENQFLELTPNDAPIFSYVKNVNYGVNRIYNYLSPAGVISYTIKVRLKGKRIDSWSGETINYNDTTVTFRR